MHALRAEESAPTTRVDGFSMEPVGELEGPAAYGVYAVRTAGGGLALWRTRAGHGGLLISPIGGDVELSTTRAWLREHAAARVTHVFQAVPV
jgi:hypothetical protein